MTDEHAKAIAIVLLSISGLSAMVGFVVEYYWKAQLALFSISGACLALFLAWLAYCAWNGL